MIQRTSRRLGMALAAGTAVAALALTGCSGGNSSGGGGNAGPVS